jgi:hypothetical protein
MTSGNSKKLLRRFPYTSAALALAIMVFVVALLWNIDVFDLTNVVIPGIEPNEMDEVVTAFLLVVPAFFVDHLVARQRTHEAHLLAEQLRVLHVTMRTVQDIVNNNLNQLQLLRLEAEGRVPEETLTLFDDALMDTAARLTALGNMEVFAEKPMASGLGLDVLSKG